MTNSRFRLVVAAALAAATTAGCQWDPDPKGITVDNEADFTVAVAVGHGRISVPPNDDGGMIWKRCKSTPIIVSDTKGRELARSPEACPDTLVAIDAEGKVTFRDSR